jgi:probable phosphoglycerate mutase
MDQDFTESFLGVFQMPPAPTELHAPRSITRLVLVRHASTAWSKSGQHTGRTDLPLDTDGEAAARALMPRLAAIGVERVYSSPLRRALHTCRLAGLEAEVIIDPGLLEWDYGEYEGRTTNEIRSTRPGWDLFRDGCPGGEDATEVGARVDDFLDRMGESAEGTVLAFAHGHVLRVLVARWLDLPPERGASFVLGAPSVSTLGWEHENPVVAGWNH